jgi:hypothetical protein
VRFFGRIFFCGGDMPQPKRNGRAAVVAVAASVVSGAAASVVSSRTCGLIPFMLSRAS